MPEWEANDLVTVTLDLYGTLVGWRSRSGSMNTPPAFAVLARAHYDDLMSTLGARERTLVLWAMRIFHRECLDLSEASDDGDNARS